MGTNNQREDPIKREQSIKPNKTKPTKRRIIKGVTTKEKKTVKVRN